MTREFELPWPPSVNHYYRHVGTKVLISRAGRKYREQIVSLIRSENLKPFTGPVELVLELYPPDRRRRDIDNTQKCLLDAFTHAGLYEDDSQIQRLVVTKREPMPPHGMTYARIEEWKENPNQTVGSNPLVI